MAWGVLVFIAFVVGVVLSVLLVLAYHEDPVFVAVEERGLSEEEFRPPSILVCPAQEKGNSDALPLIEGKIQGNKNKTDLKQKERGRSIFLEPAPGLFAAISIREFIPDLA